MFKRLHVHFTMYCFIITTSILVILTAACYQISVSSLRRNNESAFQNQITNIISYFENQSQISYDWISKTQNNKQFVLHIEDGGIPIKYSQLSQTDEESALISLAKKTAASDYGIAFDDPAITSTLSRHVEFSLTDSLQVPYLISVIVIPKEHSNLNIIMLYSLSPLEDQIHTQRSLFITLDLLAIIILSIFSWFFTGKMLRPIESNQKKQMEFVASASHELRTPLMVIQSNLSAMDDAEPDLAAQFANAAKAESQRMNLLVNDMLMLSRSDNRTWDLHLEDVELDTLLISMYEKYLPLAIEQEISIQFQIPDELLPPYRCDSKRIEQVLTILVDNALNYTPAKGKIVLHAVQHKKMLKLIVSDNGPGIPDDEKEKIFERFYRSGHSDAEKEHFGLGLCIAREIIRLHKGKLYVEDNPGGGSSFIISLPLPS